MILDRDRWGAGLSCSVLLAWSLVSGLWSPVSVVAAQLPSLFRGVAVADSPLGVRIVSVEETSQAYMADLRPEDIIVRIQGAEVRSIDEFAVVSNMLKGRAVSTTLLIFRGGSPREVVLHLYSYPVLKRWGVAFVPDHDLRFAQTQTGLEYWVRLGRGFEEAGKPAEALDAYLNALHNVPDDLAAAFKASELLSQVSRQRLADGSLEAGIAALRDALLMLERLFNEPLTDAQLQTVRAELRDTLEALRAVRGQQSTPMNR